MLGLKIPGLGGVSNAILRSIEPLFSDLFDKIIGYLWVPLRPFVQKVWGAGTLTALMTKQVYNGIGRMSQALGHFFDHMPEYVAHAFIEGFTLWLDPLLDLLEDALDEALE